ncbi:MAG: hypothetical protein JNM36_12595 [Chitinophagales bacterium]|nr:hypothetical protein [Chitinophagales bacterium]
MLFNILPLLAQDCVVAKTIPRGKDTLSFCLQRYPSLVLHRDRKEIVLWDSTMSKKIKHINFMNIALSGDHCSFIGYTSVDKGPLVFIYIRMNRNTGKWGLAGFYQFNIISMSGYYHKLEILPEGVMFLCQNSRNTLGVSAPQIYRFNEWGDMEIYNLQNVQLRDLNLPHQGLWIPSTITDSLRRKNFPPYYEHVEILPPSVK